MCIVRRKISPSIKRPQIGQQKHAHRPPPLPRHNLQGRHVKLINIRTFLAINFDIDKPAVHLSRNRLILKRLPLHDVTPVTGAVPNRKKNRLVLRTRSLECFRSPWIPIDGIVRVLKEIGRGFSREAIGVHGIILLGMAQELECLSASIPSPSTPGERENASNVNLFNPTTIDRSVEATSDTM